MIPDTVATFAGYKGTAVNYRRSNGLRPEPGWIDLSMADVKKISVLPKLIPYRKDGVELDGMANIAAWYAVQGGASVSEPDATNPVPAPAGGGFAPYHSLVLESFLDGASLGKMTYSDVLIDESGLEETLLDISGRKHDVGTLRVPLTDYRSLYRHHGVLLCRINCKLASGAWDMTSLKRDARGVPSLWPLVDVARFLLTQLPGSPGLSADSALWKEAFDAPVGIDGQGEPAWEWLDIVLRRAGLEPQYRPSGWYSVQRVNDTTISTGKVYSGPLAQSDLTGHIVTEARTVHISRAPSSVTVRGDRIGHRITLPYVPVLKHDDGNYYGLEDIASFWGVSVADLMQSVTVGAEKKFRSLLPGLTTTPRQYEFRLESLKRLFRVFAPPHLFALAQSLNRDNALFAGRRPDVATGSGGVGISPAVLERNPFKPKLRVPVLLSELKDIDERPPQKMADGSAYKLLPTLVYGSRVGPGFFSDFAKLKQHHDAVQAATSKQIADLNAKLSAIQSSAQTKELIKWAVNENGMALAAKAESAKLFGGNATAAQEKFEKIGGDIALFLAESLGGGSISGEYRIRASSLPVFSELAGQLIAAAAVVKKQIATATAAKAKQAGEWAVFEETYKKRGGVKLDTMQYPSSILPEGAAEVSESTGLLTTAIPLYRIDKPFSITGDDATVIGDGSVLVTLCYEADTNTASDWTLLTFHAEPDANAPAGLAVVLSGSGQSRPVKTHLVTAEVRTYADEKNQPFNAVDVYGTCLGRATSELRVPNIGTGFVTTYAGLRKAWLGPGVTSVQHEWDGGEAKTTVAYNAARSRHLPLGPATLAQALSTPHVDAAETADAREIFGFLP